MYRLFYMPGAASLVVHWMLIETGASYELVRLDGEAGEHKQPAYLRLNPNGLVPLLLIDGRPVYEAAALALLLAERHPEAGFAPPVDDIRREVYLQWMLHLANTVQPAFRFWFYPTEAAGESVVAAAQTRARTRLEAAFQRLDDHLRAHGPYICGSFGPTAADFYATMLVRWSRHLPKPALQWPSIAALVERMTARASFQQLSAAEDLSGWP
ncbi:MAG: glutathione S-transferase family protein [Pseudomonadota bacterium]|jgi:glutathione S-transferase